MTKDEMESRYHIYLEKYSKQINIEAGVMIDMAKRSIFPAISAYAGCLARDASSLAAVGAVSVPQEKRVKKIAELMAELYDETDKLEKVLTEAQEMDDVFAQAKSYREKVVAQMVNVRSKADGLEKLVAKTAWPFPSYEDLLFKL
jgi:glutamine synthetase